MDTSDKLNQARRCIAQAVKTASNPVLLWSSGKDSMLLLYLTRELRADVPLLWFRDEMAYSQRRFAEQMVKRFDLSVYGYPPANVYLSHTSAGLTLIREYDIGGERLPVLVDIVESNGCRHTLSKLRMTHFDYEWDISLVGWKVVDTHPLLNDVDLDNRKLGGTTFISPLKDFTDTDVWAAIRQLDVPYDRARYDERKIESDPDLLLACVDCLSHAGVQLLKAA